MERELAVIRGGMEEVAEAVPEIGKGRAGEGEGRAQRLVGGSSPSQ